MPMASEASSAAVVILAFGTRGDVQPLAVLAKGLLPCLQQQEQRQDSSPLPREHQDRIVFVSHAEHASFLRELWGPLSEGGGIAFVPSPSPPHAASSSPAAAAAGGAAAVREGKGDNRDAIEATLRPRAHFQACIDACRRTAAAPPRFILANLFALEGVHLAEALDVPLVMVHPYPAPSPAPTAFARRFRGIDPLGYKALRQAEFHPGLLAWADVEHWLWPAMTDTWDPFRRMLGLPSILDGGDEEEEEEDDADAVAAAVVQYRYRFLIGRPAPPVLYLYSETVLPRPDHFPARAHVCGYLWPDDDGCAGNAGGGGGVQDDFFGRQASCCYTPPHALAAFLADDKGANVAPHPVPPVAPVLVTFGAMVSLGALGHDLEAAARSLAAGLGFSGALDASSNDAAARRQREQEDGQQQQQQDGPRLLVDAGGNPEWAHALRQAFGGGRNGQRVLVLDEAVPHSWLLRKCSAIVHHGGSGTTAAALRAGIAQVTVPMLMDQFVWSERVASLDLGPPPLPLASVFPCAGDGDDDDQHQQAQRLPSSPPSPPPPSPLAQALAQALQPVTRLRAAAFGRRLRAEASYSSSSPSLPGPSGLARCLALIAAHVEEWPRLRAAAPSTPNLPPMPEGCSLLTLEPPGGGGDSGKEEGADDVDSALTVAALRGSEAELAFLCQEIFPPRDRDTRLLRGGWGYLAHGIRVRPGDVVLDVGANIGLFGLYLDQVLMKEPDSVTVVAVEPAPRTFAALEFNLQRHGVRHRALRLAVGEVPGRATLHFYPHMPGNSTLDARRAASPRTELNARLRAHLEAGREAVEVEVTTIPRLLEAEGLQGRVDLLKIDVEGLEEAVLRGMDAVWACVRQLVAEVHDREGARGRIDALLRGPGGFDRVVWQRPPWAGEKEKDGGAGVAIMDNLMVYATRRGDSESHS